ncbi:MAG TPA: chaperone modulator CbpM [Stellaceae bacterium]|nr:chaperone modulator CbpM [Stellaceae bacterium]
MIVFDEFLARLGMIDRNELLRWIENRWLLPEWQEDSWVFGEVDIARAELIVEIRREFSVDDDSLSLLLGLLDQVYGLRRQMRRLCEALAAQPPEIREAIRRALPPAGTGN